MPRGKNQILMNSEVHSVANTPPEALLKPVPKLTSETSVMPQPAFFGCVLSLTSQFVVSKSPAKESVAAFMMGPAVE